MCISFLSILILLLHKHKKAYLQNYGVYCYRYTRDPCNLSKAIAGPY